MFTDLVNNALGPILAALVALVGYRALHRRQSRRANEWLTRRAAGR